jgi:hypothetical protein
MLNIKKMIDDIANQGWFHQQNVFDEIFTKNAINELSNKTVTNKQLKPIQAKAYSTTFRGKPLNINY